MIKNQIYLIYDQHIIELNIKEKFHISIQAAMYYFVYGVKDFRAIFRRFPKIFENSLRMFRL